MCGQICHPQADKCDCQEGPGEPVEAQHLGAVRTSMRHTCTAYAAGQGEISLLIIKLSGWPSCTLPTTPVCFALRMWWVDKHGWLITTVKAYSQWFFASRVAFAVGLKWAEVDQPNQQRIRAQRHPMRAQGANAGSWHQRIPPLHTTGRQAAQEWAWFPP